MLYILHDPQEIEIVADELVPYFENLEFSLLSLPLSPDFTLEENDTLITYLGDSALKKLLPRISKKEWSFGILPHPEAQKAVKGFGLSEELENAINEILSNEEFCELDLLSCNDVPVFQSVNIGDVFIFSEKRSKGGFLSEVFGFLKNIRRLPGLSHLSFVISAEGEKIIHTSALGIVAVEHASGSVISKRLISNSVMNDGRFQALILSPQNLFQLLVFLFKSLIPNPKTLHQLPSFIGQITTTNLKIENDSPIEFTNDGEKFSNKEIQIEVSKEKLKLHQKSIYALEKSGANDKKSLKIDKLPTGERREQLIISKLPILPRATTEEFQELFKVLKENAKLSSSFIVMMILATLIATFGLFGDSSPVIIGAMILAPIIAPIVSFSMGMVRYDPNMLKTGIVTILIGTIVALIFAAAVSIIIPLKVLTTEINARLTPTLLDMGIAVASGIAAAYAHAKEGIAKSLAGVAIAVALVPPLAVAGIGIGWWDWEVFSGAFLLYLTNLAGIIMFAGITFLLLGFAPFKRARMGLVYTLIIIGLVMIPLSLSFNRIKQEARITSKLEGTNFDTIFLRDVKVRTGKPLMVSVKLVSPEAIDSEKMKKIKEQIEEKVGEPIILEIISAIEF
ncbi:putative hydrophobic protein (TIGR00341 family) [Gillisia sp. Hel_I_86]|uniref:TIGR00341 family protein n=1 Tax=Gillisia sp. Hel_I_86 TaxID=1249981 RepID=UPI0011994E50|nr:TIGR00341 family protein [Gillisia sp. Hel_I_86]TVZ25330.1 putative hydrophobic protein (TIGR00341 family) [Gillisia sp. Hel_I_86]